MEAALRLAGNLRVLFVNGKNISVSFGIDDERIYWGETDDDVVVLCFHLRTNHTNPERENFWLFYTSSSIVRHPFHEGNA